MKNLITIWAINEKWNTIREFNNQKEADSWISTKPIYYQVLYRINEGAIHVYKNP